MAMEADKGRETEDPKTDAGDIDKVGTGVDCGGSAADGGRDMMICNSRGLHARAAAKFVKTAERFDCVIFVEKDGQTVTGTSIMGLMMLAASPGSMIRVSADGADAAEALAALEALVGCGFHESD